VTIDAMKPITLSFVAPGMAKEYGLTSPANPHGGLPVALLPLAGISGTVIGSFLWGWFGDRIGRRASILLAAALFTTTSICGAMPGLTWNLLMCLTMGIGAGGMLPITFTLLAETVPARHRGWLMVLIGGELAAAYAVVSALTAWLVPHYSWRIMWLIGLPTGLLLILLNRWIPESPRFLLAQGRNDEAEAVLRRYGAVIVTEDQPEHADQVCADAVGADAVGADAVRADEVRGGYGQLIRRPFTGVTVAVVLLGLGAGLVAFGFQLWIPTNLQKLGLTEVTAARVLRDSAVLGLPLSVVTAWLYGFWSSKKTIILLGGLTAAALFVFAAVGDGVVAHRVLLNALLIVPIWGNGAVVAVLAAYGAEVYPTRIRARGTGLAAGASKAAGIGIITMAVAAVAAPSLGITALLGAIPLTLAIVAIGLFGVETRSQRLEEITAEQLPATAA
jgi:MFS transporter, putative metabolite:H+ symporter